jgi:chromate reductase, NAD(P)H dehydrogenase (quinone)
VFALGSASPGGFGGIRGLMQIRQVLELGLGALVLPEQIAVPRAMTAFDAEGRLADKATAAQFEAVVQRLATAARMMRETAA